MAKKKKFCRSKKKWGRGKRPAWVDIGKKTGRKPKDMKYVGTRTQHCWVDK